MQMRLRQNKRDFKQSSTSMSRHGNARMPWGKWKNVRVRLLPDDYLSWLTTTPILKEPRWRWLKDSLIAELEFRGLRADLADTADPEMPEPEPPEPLQLVRKRNITLEKP
jgi:uncharacterized protein (DUF3820 family)